MKNIVKKEYFPKTLKELNQRRNIGFGILILSTGIGLILVLTQFLGLILSLLLALLSFTFTIATIQGLSLFPNWNKIFVNTTCRKCKTPLHFNDQIDVKLVKQSLKFGKEDESKEKIVKRVFTIKVHTNCSKCAHNITFVDKTSSNWMWPSEMPITDSKKIDEGQFKEAVKAYFAQELRL
jgi:RNase P subunit RPR2